MAFAAGGSRGRVRSDINITPLVDVVLVLLIIFMVMTPIVLRQIDVAIPGRAEVALAAPPVDAPPSLVLRVEGDGMLRFDGEPIAAAALSARVGAALAGRADKTIFFDVDDQANYGVVVNLMDACRAAGATTLGIAK